MVTGVRVTSLTLPLSLNGWRSTLQTRNLWPRSTERDQTFIQRIVGHVPARKRSSKKMASVVFENASRVYPGTTKPAVDKLSLTINDGEFLVLVGPSGCGKSTSLRMLAGLEEVDTGSIRIGDKDVTHVAPKDRDIAMVFQSYALYPHMSVAENMGFALKIAGVDKAERDRRVK